jgi:hypothetical protein
MGSSSGHIPYRDSKLTRILQNSLKGNARISLIATISPTHACLEESINTCKFAQRAKAIVVRAKENEVVDEKTLLRQYREEIKSLRRLLSDIQSPAREREIALVREEKDRVSDELRRVQQERKALEDRLITLESQILDQRSQLHADGTNPAGAEHGGPVAGAATSATGAVQVAARQQRGVSDAMVAFTGRGAVAPGAAAPVEQAMQEGSDESAWVEESMNGSLSELALTETASTPASRRMSSIDDSDLPVVVEPTLDVLEMLRGSRDGGGAAGVISPILFQAIHEGGRRPADGRVRSDSINAFLQLEAAAAASLSDGLDSHGVHGEHDGVAADASDSDKMEHGLFAPDLAAHVQHMAMPDESSEESNGHAISGEATHEPTDQLRLHVAELVSKLAEQTALASRVPMLEDQVRCGMMFA